MAGLFCGGSGYLCTLASGTNEPPMEEPEIMRAVAEEVAEVAEVMEPLPRAEFDEVEMMEEMPRSLNPKMSMHRLA